MEEIARDSPLLFVRVDPIVDFPRPILHNTVFIGGLGLERDAKRDLPEASCTFNLSDFSSNFHRYSRFEFPLKLYFRKFSHFS